MTIRGAGIYGGMAPAPGTTWPSDLAVRRGARVECDLCDLTGPWCESEAEAVQLAGTHDDLLHRGEPTATVVTSGGAR